LRNTRHTSPDATGQLALVSALQFVEQVGQPSAWGLQDWLTLTRTLTPKERVVVAMHAIRGMGFQQIGDWFGFSRNRADELWRSALAKMRQDQSALAAVA
jgi:DNA-directed RNA polymerase sigma subunit (sigma70/sigma32)